MSKNDNFLLFFKSEEPEALHFVESDRFENWMEYFGEENFVGGVRAKRLETCYDLIELFLNFLGDYIFHAEKTRAIKGDPEALQNFLRSKLGGLVVFYEGEGLEKWKKKTRKNRISNGIKA